MANGHFLQIQVLTTNRLRNLFRPASAPYAEVAAFRQLYETTHLAIFRFIYALCQGTIEDAEDLTADTYERAWRARRRFYGDEDAAMGWLVTIARNLIIDRQRQQRRTPTLRPLEELETISLARTNVEQQAISHEQQAWVWGALEQLPVPEREMLILRYLLGWQVKQIAQHMEMVENTVTVRMRRALASMRQRVDPSEGDNQ